MVYIDEAHAHDEWPIQSARYNGARGPVNIPQTKTLTERRAVAAGFSRDFGFDGVPGVRTVVDSPEDQNQGEGEGVINGGPFQRAFNPWPVRFYILKEGKVRFVSSPPPGGNSDIDILPFCHAMRAAAAVPF